MKRLMLLFAVSLFLISSFQIFPQETTVKTSAEMEACFKTLQQGLNSENTGLIAGCAYMSGELRCERSIVPLLKILHNSKSEELRILAALSLYKIGDSRGIFAIKQSIKFDESERVQRMCSIFYKAYVDRDTESTMNVALK